MSNSKHTPGPWKRSHRNITANGVIVARVLPAEGGPEQEAANAHLIAAADDLLAALVDVVSIHEQVECAYAPAPCACDRYAQARAAIALAKGGAR